MKFCQLPMELGVDNGGKMCIFALPKFGNVRLNSVKNG